MLFKIVLLPWLYWSLSFNHPVKWNCELIIFAFLNPAPFWSFTTGEGSIGRWSFPGRNRTMGNCYGLDFARFHPKSTFIVHVTNIVRYFRCSPYQGFPHCAHIVVFYLHMILVFFPLEDGGVEMNQIFVAGRFFYFIKRWLPRMFFHALGKWSHWFLSHFENSALHVWAMVVNVGHYGSSLEPNIIGEYSVFMKGQLKACLLLLQQAWRVYFLWGIGSQASLTL